MPNSCCHGLILWCHTLAAQCLSTHICQVHDVHALSTSVPTTCLVIAAVPSGSQLNLVPLGNFTLHPLSNGNNGTVTSSSSPLTKIKAPQLSLSGMRRPSSQWQRDNPVYLFCQVKSLFNSLLPPDAQDSRINEVVLSPGRTKMTRRFHIFILVLFGIVNFTTARRNPKLVAQETVDHNSMESPLCSSRANELYTLFNEPTQSKTEEAITWCNPPRIYPNARDKVFPQTLSSPVSHKKHFKKNAHWESSWTPPIIGGHALASQ